MKKFILLLLVIFVIGCTNQYGTDNTSGRAVFTITDATADIGSISSIKITVNKIEVHNNESGWVMVSSDIKTYDLLELKSKNYKDILKVILVPAIQLQQSGLILLLMNLFI